MLSIIMLCVVMLSVIMLSVVMLSVVAPCAPGAQLTERERNAVSQTFIVSIDISGR